jgi:hypothetical protein
MKGKKVNLPANRIKADTKRGVVRICNISTRDQLKEKVLEVQPLILDDILLEPKIVPSYIMEKCTFSSKKELEEKYQAALERARAWGRQGKSYPPLDFHSLDEFLDRVLHVGDYQSSKWLVDTGWAYLVIWQG